VILDAINLKIDPEMKSPNLDRVVFFAENSDEFLKDAGVSLEDVVETVIHVTTVAGTTVHTVPLRSAIEQLKASQEYVREDCSVANTSDNRRPEPGEIAVAANGTTGFLDATYC
jgi:hypothetical protein